jgi:hypothetical protein
MLFRGNPDMSITPLTEFSKLLHFGMTNIFFILDRKILGIKDADIAPKPKQDATSFKCHET